jgi:hypothetical protein
MGHINHDDLREMVRKGAITGVDLDPHSVPEFCEICIKAKATRRPFPKESDRRNIKVYGDKVVADVWGPARVESLGGKRFFVCFLDLNTHEERGYFLAKKSDTFDASRYLEATAVENL